MNFMSKKGSFHQVYETIYNLKVKFDCVEREFFIDIHCNIKINWARKTWKMRPNNNF